MSAQDIVNAAMEFAAEARVFDGGCSDMVRTAYAAGGISIPTSYDANAILSNYPCPANLQPGDVAGWIEDPHGHVVVYLGPNSYSNCPGEGQATRLNQNMGHELVYVRPANAR